MQLKITDKNLVLLNQSVGLISIPSLLPDSLNVYIVFKQNADTNIQVQLLSPWPFLNRETMNYEVMTRMFDSFS